MHDQKAGPTARRGERVDPLACNSVHAFTERRHRMPTPHIENDERRQPWIEGHASFDRTVLIFGELVFIVDGMWEITNGKCEHVAMFDYAGHGIRG